MDWSADKLSAATKNPLPLGMGSVKREIISRAETLNDGSFRIIDYSEASM